MRSNDASNLIHDMNGLVSKLDKVNDNITVYNRTLYELSFNGHNRCVVLKIGNLLVALSTTEYRHGKQWDASQRPDKYSDMIILGVKKKMALMIRDLELEKTDLEHKLELLRYEH